MAVEEETRGGNIEEERVRWEVEKEAGKGREWEEGMRRERIDRGREQGTQSEAKPHNW